MGTSSLTPNGSTRQWRKLRAAWTAKIEMAAALGEPVTCWRTGKPIYPTDTWDLGHRTDRADGGTDADVWPEHATPNRAAGGQRRHQQPRTRRW